MQNGQLGLDQGPKFRMLEPPSRAEFAIQKILKAIEKSLLLQERKRINDPALAVVRRFAPPVAGGSRICHTDGEGFLCRYVIEDGDAQLAKIVDALSAPRRFPGRLYRGQEQRDQHGNDSDHDQQLNERKTGISLWN